MSYLFVKWIHVVSATVLFGTGIGTAFYMFMANRRGEAAEIHAAARTVVLADFIFTAPSAFVQLVTGVMLVQLAGYSFSDLWVWLSLVLYAFAGACWLPVIALQFRMRDLAKTASDTGAPLPDRYRTLDRWWIILGSLAFPALLIVLFLMVFKPTSWTP